jgi:hypothetical protein
MTHSLPLPSIRRVCSQLAPLRGAILETDAMLFDKEVNGENYQKPDVIGQ